MTTADRFTEIDKQFDVELEEIYTNPSLCSVERQTAACHLAARYSRIRNDLRTGTMEAST